jgi:molybdopterin-containing oxidoreductase family iron-sulfur binding subunit
LGVADGDPVTLTGGGAVVSGPALTVPGQADGAATVQTGYGRSHAGPIGSGVGFSVAGLGPIAKLTAGGVAQPVLQTQSEFGQHDRDLLKTVATPDMMIAAPVLPSFYERPKSDNPRAWAMVIDTDICTGCNACTIACQSENNVPVVGPDEVAMGRIMHWLRIDAYDLPEGGRAFQPVPCMHCEEAPCEPVCPVGASVHDSEGLNVQVYNRCIGTRFCQADCPYKVRRFNFHDYAGAQAYETQGADLLKALKNPDVSVRSRGVMEKCTYCVQRISSARREAERENREIADGEVVTACQAACPAEAIGFGNLNDPESAVRAAKDGPRHYALLGELGTKPRTTYLARVTPKADAT